MEHSYEGSGGGKEAEEANVSPTFPMPPLQRFSGCAVTSWHIHNTIKNWLWLVLQPHLQQAV